MNAGIEPYPEGTPVVMQIQLGISEKPVTMRGLFISVPIPVSGSQLPANDGDAPPYVIRLVEGSTHRISPLNMEVIFHVEWSVSGERSIAFPTWSGSSQKVMYSHEGEYKKGSMEFNLETGTWRFSQRRHNGIEIWGG